MLAACSCADAHICRRIARTVLAWLSALTWATNSSRSLATHRYEWSASGHGVCCNALSLSRVVVALAAASR
eukprot:719686-Alexandrium_andersonii.AAC.1